jgi:hypothetical protein
MINQLTHASEEQKVEVQSMLCMDYLAYKNGLSSICALSKASNHSEQEPVVPEYNKLQSSLVDKTNGITHQLDVSKQTKVSVCQVRESVIS